MKSPLNSLSALFDGPGTPFRIVERPLPRHMGAGQVLVRIRLATVCGSDLHTVLGRRPGRFPCILGHEAVGEVLRFGAGRSDAEVGQRVTWPLLDSCGTCRPCTEWRLPQKCRELFKYGHEQWDPERTPDGCYSTHIVVRGGTPLVPVPMGLADEVVAPANCALATVMAVLEEVPSPCETVWVQGCGLLGLYSCAVLRTRGVGRIAVSDVDPARRMLAVEFGADPALAKAGQGPGPGTADLVVEVAGSAEVFPSGLSALRPGGHYRLAGMVLPGTRLEATGEALIRGCLTVRGFHNYRPDHLRAAIRFLAEHRESFPWGRLVSPAFALDGIGDAFRLAAAGRFARVAIAP